MLSLPVAHGGKMPRGDGVDCTNGDVGGSSRRDRFPAVGVGRACTGEWPAAASILSIPLGPMPRNGIWSCGSTHVWPICRSCRSWRNFHVCVLCSTAGGGPPNRARGNSARNLAPAAIGQTWVEPNHQSIFRGIGPSGMEREYAQRAIHQCQPHQRQQPETYHASIRQRRHLCSQRRRPCPMRYRKGQHRHA